MSIPLANTIADCPESRPRSARRSWHQAFKGAVWSTTARSGAISILDQAVLSGTNFATSVLIGRLCGEAELGVYFLAMSIVLFARGIQDQIIGAPYAVYCHRHSDRALRSYSGSTLIHEAVLIAIVVVVTAFVTGVLYSGWGPRDLAPATLLLPVVAPFFLLRAYARSLALGRLQVQSAFRIDASVGVIQVGTLVVLGALGVLTAPLAVGSIGLGCAVTTLVWLFVGRHQFRVELGRAYADWQHNWAFGKWALGSHVVGSTSPAVLPWILTAATGPTGAGRFGACMTVIGLAYVIVGGITYLVVPWAARSYARGGKVALRRTTLINIALLTTPAFAFCILMLVAGEQLTVLLFGPAFAGSGTTVLVMGGWLLANSLGIAAGSTLWAIERPQANLPADVCCLLATLLGAALLVYPLGALGAAVAMAAGTTIGTIVRWGTVAREFSKLGTATPERL